MKSFFVSLALLLAGPAIAGPAPVTVAHPYSYPTASPGVPGVGFLQLINTGKKADRLLSVTSPVAGTIEIHESRVVDGVMQMRALPKGLVLPAGKTVALAPGGTHLMLFALQAPLVTGQSVPLTLKFERAGEVATALKVEPREPAPAEPATDHSQHQH